MNTPTDEPPEEPEDLRRGLGLAHDRIDSLTKRVELIAERGRLMDRIRLLETRVQVAELTDKLRQLHLMD